MFDPIKAAEELKESYIDYITTTFDMADADYHRAFREELRKPGMIAKGPFLDIGGSYQTGRTLGELISAGEASPLFKKLEPVAEKERELKLERPLYSHQEMAFLRAVAGENLVVTTGTGSGKTEAFLLPILNHLLREQESGNLSHGVRAIVVYPMNALANDQMKRMRALLKGYPQITYGVYNGNTRHKQSDALREYSRTFHDASGNPASPAPNELISRENMQRTPPHILITNYSMLEYMMLRPNDDAVFSGAKLRYIVLDEAHIYKGATGMETSLLMRRLRARISEPDSVQYILTSATLGGPDADAEILNFAGKLCGVPFRRGGIVRSKEKKPPMVDFLNFPPELFEELDSHPSETAAVLSRYNADFAPEADDNEKIYALCLRSALFGRLREAAVEPITVMELRKALSDVRPLTKEQVVAFISVCARAEKDGASLIKPRYHFFVRALEGAYLTLKAPKKLYLQRRTQTEENYAVFEAAVCTDCGRVALVGRQESGLLVQAARRGIGDTDDYSDYYCLRQSDDGEALEEDFDAQDGGMEDYAICPVCGALSTQADVRIALLNHSSPCGHPLADYQPIRKARKLKDSARCPACGFGHFRRFYLGSEAATAVLGTELFEQLPSEEVTVVTPPTVSASRSVFARSARPRYLRKELPRQFLCVSDSRSEAAFFAPYMERHYQEFLRRRGVWHTVERFRADGRDSVPVAEFADALRRYYEERRSFVSWENADKQDTQTLSAISQESRKNAWVAILNEMYNARRSTGLVSMGVLAFEYSKNDEAAEAFGEAYGLSEQDARALLELLAQDAVFSGAIKTSSYKLDDAEREYIFFAPVERKLVLLKTAEMSSQTWVSGWRGRKRSNGNFYLNSRILRLTRALRSRDDPERPMSEDEADELLKDYWDGVFQPETEQFSLDANDFRVRIGGAFYRCRKCGRVTPYNVKNQCASVKCNGVLEAADLLRENENNHFAKLYSNNFAEPLYMKEHTAQLSRDQQTIYQNAFVQKKINALSCSTTFEMGVDLGSLETVYLRDIPPSPANYVQRAGRAGRSLHSAAFVLTYAKLSSHDFTYFQNPPAMITGKIHAPVFEIENEKIINRHIFAVALSAFFKVHNEVYAGDDQTVLLNEGGYEVLKEYLAGRPENLRQTLLRSIPSNMHERLGIVDFGWVERLCGENGVLEIAVTDFRRTVTELEKALNDSRRRHNDEEAAKWRRSLRNFRCAKEDREERRMARKSLIEFLARNNVLPKYGFPVDTVELIPEMGSFAQEKSLQLARDLQIAIGEYAPGSQVIADGRMYVSRYIRQLPYKGHSWETGNYCPKCPKCEQPNFTKEPLIASGRECVSCHELISKRKWQKTLEPRLGFYSEKDEPAPMQRPKHDYRTDDYYIGDPHKNLIQKLAFQVNGQTLVIESTSNDSLVVIGQTPYNVCPVCGYADAKEIPLKHKTVRGYDCKNQEGSKAERRLSHDFKTDVARITFSTPEAADWPTMVSVLYALLEGLSREMGIERTDIKGCLFLTETEGMRVWSVVLYDAVAGGAGHVRRIVKPLDGSSFQKILSRAISVVDSCKCDGSCYQCLRNYYNQKIHDDLDRRKASAFLRQWTGPMTAIAPEPVAEC